MNKLLQAIEQCKAAGAHLSMFAYVKDGEKFAGLATLAGATVEQGEWTCGDDGNMRVRESFQVHIDGVRMDFVCTRKPTMREWTTKMEAVKP